LPALDPRPRPFRTPAVQPNGEFLRAESGHLVCSPDRHSFKICAVAFNPDGRWGLVDGRDPALGTRTAQAWEFITGKPVTPPLGAYGMAHSIVVSPDGAGALASTDNKTFLQWLDLADLSAPDEMDGDDLGTFAGLTSDEWLSRWRTFRKRHAQLEEAVEVFKGEIQRNGHWLMPPGGRRT
jgi:WD40 repeat protein